ncbi:MAG: hypothetical protein K2Q20_06555, partial [Phycisphaerales bacterium]|nr:hypothetical protein [Phycisphaerales bacterium]
KELKKTGVFMLPGFAKFMVVKKPATTDTVVVVNNGTPSAMGSARVVVSSGQANANPTNGRVDIDTGLGVAPSAVVYTVHTATTGVQKTGYVRDLATVPGTIRLDGVNAGVQLDAGDIVDVIWFA